jgi:hypothetical protein
MYQAKTKLDGVKVVADFLGGYFEPAEHCTELHYAGYSKYGELYYVMSQLLYDATEAVGALAEEFQESWQAERKKATA